MYSYKRAIKQNYNSVLVFLIDLYIEIVVLGSRIKTLISLLLSINCSIHAASKYE